MSKPTKRKSDSPGPGKVHVYNSLSRVIHCQIAVEQLIDKARRPHRSVRFLPGNNTVEKSDWSDCLQNAAFKVYLEQGSYPEGGGKFRGVTPLIEGKFDKNQEAEEAALMKRVEAERARLSTDGA